MSDFLHYGDQAFELTEREGFSELAKRISNIDGSGWVDVSTPTGGVTLWIAPGIPIWFDRRARNQSRHPAFES